MRGKVAIIIECKEPGSELSLKHASQLYRYFSVTDARFSILTNGYRWEFYTDLDDRNKMDTQPFLVLSLEDLNSSIVSELAKFQKSEFDEDSILSVAENLKYVSALKRELKNEFENPSEEMTKLLGKRVYERMFSAQVQERFQLLLKKSFNEFVRDRVNARLSNALQKNQVDLQDEESVDQSTEIETTEEELEGYRISVAIAASELNPNRIHIRDVKNYCGVLIDDNNRKPLLRLWFNSATTKYIGLFDNDIEEKVRVDSPVDIYQFADRIRATAKKYL